MDQQAWIDVTRKTIGKILKGSIPQGISNEERKGDEKIVGVMIDDTNIFRWGVAFTHSSVDPNPSGNYEAYEILGDKVLGLVFTELVQYQYRLQGKEAEPGRITELLSDIMGSRYQDGLCVKWGLDKLLQSNAPKVKKTNSDIFEAFFGMLMTIGNIIHSGMGHIWSYNVLSYMLKDVNLVTYNVDQPKVYINEVLTRYNATYIKPYTKLTDNGRYSSRFEIPEALAVEWGLTKKGPFIQVEQFGKTSSIAKDMAYKNLAQLLKAQKITTRVTSISQHLWFKAPLDALYRKAIAKKEYVDFRINSFSDVANNYIQLIGVKDDGYLEVISANNYSTTGIDTNKVADLLNAYINSPLLTL